MAAQTPSKPDAIVQKMQRADNADRLMALYDGGWEQYYNSEFQAVSAAAVDFAWWTQHDQQLALELFRKSSFDSSWERVFNRRLTDAIEQLGDDMYDPEWQTEAES